MTRGLAILIPAAGASSRMRGRDKLLEEVEGRPLLALLAGRARAVADTVIVTLPEPPGARGAALAALDVTCLALPEARQGMAASLRAGVAALPPDIRGLMILPADMPEIRQEDMQRLADAFAKAPEAIWQGAAEDGTPGHPVLFPADCLPAIAAVTGDTGAREVLRAQAHRVRRLALPGRRALTDLDTPEDWARWRAQRAADRTD
ncbi:NTP transferase domain-containing protein [Rhodosalinus sp. 5P4]|uniref:nucleotidyltransferase family protein n=1 Tax=Rhodosalinus sp. 5P4 TaxID=3239196 RepID=UPI0035236C3B